jgi:hypothetical protein
MANWLATKKQSLKDKYRRSLREKAIARAKVEIALAGKYVSDYDQEQLEVIVAAEEKKLLEKYRNSAFVVALLALGLY